jgi:hypothetical protein
MKAKGLEVRKVLSDELRQLIEHYWHAGIGFEVEEIGAEYVDTGEMAHQKQKRLVLYGLPVFLMGAHDLALLRQHEAEIVEYLEGRDDAP